MASSQTPCPSPRQLTYCVEEYLRACETHNVRPVQEVQERLGNPLATVLATSEWPRRVWTNGDIMALTAGLAVNRVVKTVALPRLGPAVLTVEVLGTVAAALLRTRCVTSLDLSGNDLSDDAVLALDSLLLGSNGPLVVLDVSRNDVGLRGGRMLARAIQLARRLRCLDMRFNPLGGPQSPIGRLLVDALRARHSFRRLAVHLPEGSGEALTVALREGSVRLQSLILAHRRSDLHSVDQLATLLRTPLTSLTHLDLTHAYIGDTGAHVLGEALGHNSALVSLSLQSNAITTRGVTSFVQGIKENVTLTDINLSSNTLGDAGASTLASFVRENAVLTSLDLGRNGIGDEGATALLQVFQGSYNTTLVTLGDLSSTPMSVAIRHSLEGAVTRNRDRAMEMADRAAADVLLRRGHLSQADMDLPSSLRYNRALQRYAVLADSFERLKAENALLKTELEEMRQSEGVKREKDTRSGRRGGKYKGRRRSSRK